MTTHVRRPLVALDPEGSASDRIDAAAAALLASGEPLVLAVSGGLDSMVLLQAIGAASAGGARACVVVATYDHGTGVHAERAVDMVRECAARWGLAFVTAKSARTLRGEAAWRAARWRFLHEVAAERRARVATAHTLDDHLETVVMRILRDAGARGLSGMRAPSPVLRPLLAIDRATVAQYAAQNRVAWTDDPSNEDRAYLRNRVRLELLPALRRVRPDIDAELLALAERAAALRRECADAVRPLVHASSNGRVRVARVADAEWSADARALLCQTVAECGGLALDWRGTERLARFIVHGRVGSRVPLSGGFEAVLHAHTLELRRTSRVPDPVPLRAPWEARFGAWRFQRQAAPTPDGMHDPWTAWLAPEATLEVRPWRNGDRMTSSGSGPRRVKRFLSDSRVPAADRAGWPVVVSDGEIVWIPGVRRSRAASARSGRPGVCIVCERIEG